MIHIDGIVLFNKAKKCNKKIFIHFIGVEVGIQIDYFGLINLRLKAEILLILNLNDSN